MPPWSTECGVSPNSREIDLLSYCLESRPLVLVRRRLRRARRRSRTPLRNLSLFVGLARMVAVKFAPEKLGVKCDCCRGFELLGFMYVTN